MLDNMTIYDDITTMKNVKIADLKARLSQHLREVRRGHPLIVLDRDTPVACLVPYSRESEPLVVRQPLRKYRSLQRVPIPPPLKLDIDIVSLLIEERERKR
jgi:prevent-host-death family protein